MLECFNEHPASHRKARNTPSGSLQVTFHLHVGECCLLTIHKHGKGCNGHRQERS